MAVKQINLPQLISDLAKTNPNLSQPEMYRKLIVDQLKEIKTQTALSHPHVVKAFGYSVDRDFLIVMELCATDLENFVFGRSVDSSQILEFLRQMASVIAAMHARGMIHRDLKPQNVLLTSELLVKLGDFGLCASIKEVLSGMDMSSYVVSTLPFEGFATVNYVAPEQLGSQVKRRSECWTLGLIACALITKIHPYNECQNIHQITNQIANGVLPDIV